MSSRPIFRVGRDLAEAPSRIADLAAEIAALLATNPQPAPSADGGPPNSCDEDPDCDYLGTVVFEGIVYKTYDCNGEIALYAS